MSKFTITLEEAKSWAKKWRTSPPKELAYAHLIKGEVLSAILAAENVVDVRVYMGVDENGDQKLILVGVDANGKDLIDTNHLIYDRTVVCPPGCDASSPLINL
jgi:hypothetical protein